jgi:hypothetical protein
MDTLSYEYGRQLSHDHPTEIWVVPLAATSGPKASSASEEACAVPSTATDNCVKSFGAQSSTTGELRASVPRE